MNLRENKKNRTKKSILATAGQVFTEKGYEEASILEIAERAGVGVGTIYNYYPSKQDIYLAFFSEGFELDDFSAEGIQLKGKTALEAISVYMFKFCSGIFSMNKGLLQNLMNITFKAGLNSVLMKSFYELDMRFLVKFESFLTELKKDGLLDESIDVGLLSEIIYSVSGMELILCLIQGRTKDSFENRLSQKLEYILRG